jgi:FlaA1/EpsC-like NDP-sugar epimerase
MSSRISDTVAVVVKDRGSNTKRATSTAMSKRFVTRSLQIVVDLGVLCIAYIAAFLFRFEFELTLQQTKLLFFTLPYVVLFEYVVLAVAGVPALAWRFVGLRDVRKIGTALSAAAAVLVALRIGLEPFRGQVAFLRIPLGALAMNFVMSVLAISSVRIARRLIGERRDLRDVMTSDAPKRTLLVGAGSAGFMVAKEIALRPDLGMEVIGFADDDPVKVGTIIQGARVLGDTYSLPKLIPRYDVEQVIITMGSASADVIRRVVQLADHAGRPAKIIPALYEILDGRVNLTRIREVTIEDLLGREAIDLDINAMRQFVRGKTVLVTGAGGSIGSELCRQVAHLGPGTLVLAELSENALFHIHGELARTHADCKVAPCICDVRDRDRIDAVFAEHKPDIVFHAAAHKHVPMVEWNPGEAIKNNVFGTKEVADAADRHCVAAFVMISTDKAVNPTSVMGATKRVAELYIQSMSEISKTTFVGVRFGNVLGSTGSVIPIFKEQIQRGGPITVTHPDMQRYFMTIPEASQLVLQAATMGNGGEIFVLDMGAPVKIVNLARDLIRLSGFSEDEISIEFTGVRPGEKLFEELATELEDLAKTRHPKILIGKIAAQPRETVLAGFERLAEMISSSDRDAVRMVLGALVPEMHGLHEDAAHRASAEAAPLIH